MRVTAKVCILCGYVHDEKRDGPLDENFECPDCGAESIMFEDQEIEV